MPPLLLPATARARHRLALLIAAALLVSYAELIHPGAKDFDSEPLSGSGAVQMGIETMSVAEANLRCPSLSQAARSCRRGYKSTPHDLINSQTPRYDALLSVWGSDTGHRRRRRLKKIVEWDEFELAQLKGLDADFNASKRHQQMCARSSKEALGCLATGAKIVDVDCGKSVASERRSDVLVPTSEWLLDAFDAVSATSLLISKDMPMCSQMLDVMRGDKEQSTVTSNGLTRQLHNGVPKASRSFWLNDCFYASSSDWSSYFTRHSLGPELQSSLALQDSGVWRCAATVLLMGAQKASSTELRSWLVRHPLVEAVTPWRSEPHILTPLHSFENPFAAYLAQTVLSAGDVARGMRLLDKTPGYFHVQGMATKIAGMFPGSLRMVVLLRDPAERLVSGIWNVCFFRKATCEAADVEAVAMGERAPGHWLYATGVEQKRIGMYDSHLANFIGAFRGKTDAALYIGFADHFKRDPLAVMRRVEDFLALPHANYSFERVENDLKSVSNATLRFNRLHVPGYVRPTRALIEMLRVRHYSESLQNLRGLLQSSDATSGLKMTVEEWPDWLRA